MMGRDDISHKACNIFTEQALPTYVNYNEISLIVRAQTAPFDQKKEGRLWLKKSKASEKS